MQQSSSGVFAEAPNGIRCPHCLGIAYRTRRRWVDRLFSLLVSVRRYWCYECHWQGNLRPENVVPFSLHASRFAIATLAATLEAARQRRAGAPDPSVPAAPRRRAAAVAARGFGS